MLTMVDMDVGNLQSVSEAFRRVGAAVEITDTPAGIDAASVLILPGVGAFGDAMEQLRAKGLVEPIRTHALGRRRPLRGICLGMQLLADESEEHGLYPGLGLIRGRVLRLHPSQPGFRVPNMGWCDVADSRRRGWLRPGDALYFAHSYHLACSDRDDIVATIEYSGSPVTVAVERNNIIGVQFHPEKSQGAGLNLLEALVSHLEEHAGC